jgi:hypothetical protein
MRFSSLNVMLIDMCQAQSPFIGVSELKRAVSGNVTAKKKVRSITIPAGRGSGRQILCVLLQVATYMEWGCRTARECIVRNGHERMK